MGEQLYRLAYCSRNLIQGEPSSVNQQIQSILMSARAKNARMKITGALYYNAGSFAQVLEGPLDAVCTVFERIQQDARHSEVIVVQNGPASDRFFPDWSMAYAGAECRPMTPMTTEVFEAAFADEDGAGDKVLAMLRELVTQENDWALSDYIGQDLSSPAVGDSMHAYA